MVILNGTNVNPIGDWIVDIDTSSKISLKGKGKGKGKKGKGKAEMCPCCLENDPRCKSASGTLRYCWNVSEDAMPEGWWFGKSLAGGMGSLVAPSQRGDSEEWISYEEFTELKKKEKEEREAQKLQKLSALTPTATKDVEYRRLLSGFTLSQFDRDRLSDRGLTHDEIDFCQDKLWLKSWQAGRKFTPLMEIPGIWEGETRKYRGMLISSVTHTGELSGGCISPNEVSEQVGKYYWVSNTSEGGKSCQLEDGSLPLFFRIHPRATRISRIYLCEGGLKSLVTAIKIWKEDKDAIIVGTALSMRYTEAFYDFLEQHRDVPVVILPDRSSIEKINILSGIKQTWKRCSELTTSPASIGVFGDVDIDDFLAKEGGRIEDISLVSLDEWAQQDEEVNNVVSTVALSLSIEKQKNTYEGYRKWSNKDERIGNVVVNQPRLVWEWEEGCVGSNIQCQRMFPRSGEILAIKANTGVGKSYLVRHWLNNLFPDDGAIFLGYRNGLLLQLCSKDKGVKGLIHLHDPSSDGFLLRGDPNGRIAFCDASIHHFTASQFIGKWLVIDEVMSVLTSILTSSTCAKGRNKRLELFRDMLQLADRVVVLDANMEDWVMNLLVALSGKTEKRITNEYRGKSLRIISAQGTLKNPRDKSWIRSRIQEDAVLGLSIAVFSDSQIELETIHSLLRKKGVEEKEILRIDSTNSSEIWCQEALKDIDLFLDLNPIIRIVLVSPSGDSGIDMAQEGRFGRVYLLACGTLDHNSLIQMLGRVRDREPERIIWINNQVFDGGKVQNAIEIDREFTMALDVQLRMLMDCPGSNLEDLKEWVFTTVSEWKKKEERDGYSQAIGILKSKALYEKKNYRSLFEKRLIDMGYEVVRRYNEKDLEVSRDFSETSREVKEEHCKKISKAEEISKTEADRIRVKVSPNEPERLSLRKYDLSRRMPGVELTDELLLKVLYQDRQLLGQLEQRYYLSHPEIAQELSEIRWSRAIVNQEFFVSDMRSRIVGVTTFLRELEIEGFMNDNEVTPYCKEMRELRKRWTQLEKKWGKEEVEAVLGFGWNKSSPLLTLYKLLKLVGCELTKLKKRSDKRKVEVRKVARRSLVDPMVVDILSSFDLRFKELGIKRWEEVKVMAQLKVQ